MVWRLQEWLKVVVLQHANIRLPQALTTNCRHNQSTLISGIIKCYAHERITITHTTMHRPMTECSPVREIIWSVRSSVAFPFASASTFPRSPTWRSAASGAPWFLLWGLKWAPAEMQPFVWSPNSWTWKPCFPGFKPSNSAWMFTLSPCRLYKECYESIFLNMIVAIETSLSVKYPDI